MVLRRHLVIFARYPILGAGKRRLAHDVGAVQALRVQRVMLGHALRRLADRRWLLWLAVTPDRSGPWRARHRLVAQGSGNLGDRMTAVARRLPPGPVVIVGSDVPGIMGDDVARAFRALGNCDAVFGPAHDGGYWLIGLRRRPRFVDPFRNVRWSSPHALADTRRNLSGNAIALLNSRRDVDDGASLAWHRRWDRLNDRVC
ncbi:MAG: TIGR04282 family arsenosugar biosynthesis glycosyltransferase [Alphaproteobacteria bacterium]|nr:TIGR04282 family arsenosugar biosynthesis glycosyltransferase [Alphaproteobacteria bacterium]